VGAIISADSEAKGLLSLRERIAGGSIEHDESESTGELGALIVQFGGGL